MDYIGQQITNGTYEPIKKTLTAYEELKAWCKKHLAEEEWATEENYRGNVKYIDLYNSGYQEVTLWFSPNGAFDDMELRE